MCEIQGLPSCCAVAFQTTDRPRYVVSRIHFLRPYATSVYMWSFRKWMSFATFTKTLEMSWPVRGWCMVGLCDELGTLCVVLKECRYTLYNRCPMPIQLATELKKCGTEIKNVVFRKCKGRPNKEVLRLHERQVLRTKRFVEVLGKEKKKYRRQCQLQTENPRVVLLRSGELVFE